ncbi:hypothetical protein ACFV1W_34635 [Kitasatospora sp. NPDC059648]|uniref:hypothetical protein n=1 Tax=Kitasatospora sp. NPDC059648 TaxID=3346894 RepID=UPI0036A4864C
MRARRTTTVLEMLSAHVWRGAWTTGRTSQAPVGSTARSCSSPRTIDRATPTGAPVSSSTVTTPAGLCPRLSSVRPRSAHCTTSRAARPLPAPG